MFEREEIYHQLVRQALQLMEHDEVRMFVCRILHGEEKGPTVEL